MSAGRRSPRSEKKPTREVKKVSVADFAELIGRTHQRVYQLIQKGMPHRREKGVTMIVPSEAIKWWLEYETWELQEQRRKAEDSDEPDAKTETARKIRAERMIKELELMKMSKELVPRLEFDEFVERVFGGFAAVVHGRLQRFERDIVRATTPAEARKMIEKLKIAMMNGARSYGDQLDDEAAEIEREAALAAAAARKSKRDAAAEDESEDKE